MVSEFEFCKGSSSSTCSAPLWLLIHQHSLVQPCRMTCCSVSCVTWSLPCRSPYKVLPVGLAALLFSLSALSSLKTWLSYFLLWRAFIPPFSNLSTITIKAGCRGPPWCSHRNCVFPCKWKTWLFFFPLVIYVSTTKHKLPREESWVPSESNIWQSSSPRVALNKY